MRKLALILPSHLMFKPYSDFVQLYWGEKNPSLCVTFNCHTYILLSSGVASNCCFHFMAMTLFFCLFLFSLCMLIVQSIGFHNVIFLSAHNVLGHTSPIPPSFFPLPPLTPFVPLGFTSSLMFYNYTWSSVSIWNLGAASVRRHVVSDFLRLPRFFYYDYLWLHPFSCKQHSFIFYIAENFSFIFVCVNV